MSDKTCGTCADYGPDTGECKNPPGSHFQVGPDHKACRAHRTPKDAKLDAIRIALDIDGEGDAVDNLYGAFVGMERTGKASKACLNTVRRVLGQLEKVENILDENDA